MDSIQNAPNITNHPVTFSNKVCDLVKRVVCDYYEMPYTIFYKRNRERMNVKVRQVSCYFMQKLLPKVTLKYIGEQIAYNHATVIHSIKTMNNIIDTDRDFKREISEIYRILESEQATVQFNGNIDKDFYYINMDECISIKFPDGKAIVLTGYTEVEAQQFIGERIDVSTVEHHKTRLFILQKK